MEHSIGSESHAAVVKQGRGVRIRFYSGHRVSGDKRVGEPCLGLLEVVLDFVVEGCFPCYRFEGVGDIFEQCFIAVYQCCHCYLVCWLRLALHPCSRRGW